MVILYATNPHYIYIYISFAESGTFYLLVRLSKKLLKGGIPINIITLPLRFEDTGNYTVEDMQKFSRSESIVIFTMSDTQVVRDYLKKVRFQN